MPRLDSIHSAVKNALVKDGWLITADPYKIRYEEITLYADLAAEKPIVAMRSGQKILVEVKSLVGLSKLQDLKEALGQYDIYFYLMQETEPERKLYVAVSETAYKDFFNRKAIQLIINRHRLPLIVVDIDTEEIVTWIN
ncbi:MAG: XisH family protein [Acidobacteriota bacterium]